MWGRSPSLWTNQAGGPGLLHPAGGRRLPSGEQHLPSPGKSDYHTVPWQALLSTGVKQGRTSAPGGGPSSLLYTVQISERYSYSVISVAPAKAYTTDRLYELILWTVGLILVFVLITLLYARQFFS